MFCSKCGKQIDYDAVVCNECSGNQSFFVEEVQKPTVEEKPKTSRSLGIGNAISGAVLGYIALIFSAIGMCYSIVGVIAFIIGMTEGPEDPLRIGVAFLAIGVVFGLVGLIMSIVSLKKGIASIKLAKKSSPKPIATLVLGIVSVDYAAAGLIMFGMGFAYSALISMIVVLASIS